MLHLGCLDDAVEVPPTLAPALADFLEFLWPPSTLPEYELKPEFEPMLELEPVPVYDPLPKFEPMSLNLPPLEPLF